MNNFALWRYFTWHSLRRTFALHCGDSSLCIIENIYLALWRIFTVHRGNIYLALWWTLNLCCRNHRIILHYWEHLPSAMETIYCTLHCGEHLPYTVKNICPALCEHLICWGSNFSHFSVIFLPAWACSGLAWPILPFQQCCRARLRLRLSKSFRSGSGDSSDLGFEGTCFHSF
jgi:hypothetical protein